MSFSIQRHLLYDQCLLLSVIFPESTAGKELSKSDRDKRMKAYAQKKAKLANPNFFVSMTRLCVRNLPTRIDEKSLKALFQRHATGHGNKVVQVEGEGGGGGDVSFILSPFFSLFSLPPLLSPSPSLPLSCCR